MTILNITNITNDPVGMITNSYRDAFESVSKDYNIRSINNSEVDEFIQCEIDNLIKTVENAKTIDGLSIVDNYLVNYDYYATVRDFLINY